MSRLQRQFALVVDSRELATILAALRFHQDENLRTGSDIADRLIQDIATDAGSLELLDFKEVDSLCERMNTCYEIRAGRQKEGWVVVVTDKCSVVHVHTYSSKTAARGGLFTYLRERQHYDGRQDLRAVRRWIKQHGKNMKVDIVRQDTSASSLDTHKETPDSP